MGLSADRYAALAYECLAQSRVERDPGRQAIYLELARCYQALIDQAQRNAAAEIVYETPPVRPPGAPSA